ncbi:hypothetical protein E4631_20745 [Hymenobacter sp. UV11]|uniref:hypothetical protein n=1 Tax=Hymenobacter sp. UV11 TaxID=1849735 RepID=UPI00105D622D|nr:hypothetical protein [Hymenobacter sp. UV11]TDN40033.1 hypothetical protein A8B98_15655 [Hymenobacter sp. UV11]TFZ64054.1 hypothetical protein E4631_20745 [Hymenobacter sp. UV11]
MFTQLASTTRSLGCYLLAAPLLLALVLNSSCAQKVVAPVPTATVANSQATKMPTAIIYVDGQRQDSTALRKINPADIASINVVKGEAARAYAPTADKQGIIFVTTKQNQDRADVAAFNKSFPLTPATPAQNAAVAAIMAYMTKAYPTARLETVGPLEGSSDRYRATFKQSDQRRQLLFDGQGQPVKE